MADTNVDEQLQVVLSQSKNDTPDLKETGDAFQAIANALRLPTAAPTRDSLGKSELPETLVTVWKSAIPDGSVRPTGDARSCVLETLRVAANLCNDNDANRQRLLDVGLIQLLLPLLDAYSQEGVELELEDLKLAKTSLGFLLNVSMKNDTLRAKLIELDTPTTVLKLSGQIYGVGSWTKTVSGEEEPEGWTWRSGLSGWTRRLLESLHELEPTPEFKPSCLPYLLKPLDVFGSQGSRTPTATHTSAAKSTEPSPPDLIAADLDALEASCTLLESLTLDSEAVRLAIASDANLLRIIIRFIEFAQPLPEWRTNDSTGKDKWEKTVGLCKGAVIKALVTVAGEDKAISNLWDDTKLDGGNQGAPGGWFVAAMLAWIKQHRNVAPSDARDDLVICATLALGNLARRDDYCMALVAPPSSIVPDLVPFITPAADMKLKHGVLGLLKHLAQPVPNKMVLGDAGILEALSSSGIWDSESDRAEAVQASAVGIAKHLCIGNVSNTLRLVLPPPTAQSATSSVASPVIDDGSDDEEPSGMDQVINLSQRSDTVALKSEAARVLVNAVKSLWSPAGPEESIAVSPAQRKRAVRRLSNRQSTRALAELVGRSRRYPVLLNEGIVALTLLGSQFSGAPHVISAFDRALDVPMAVVTGTKPSAEQGGTLEHPKLLDMLEIIMKNEDKAFPPQLRANVCTLFGSVSSMEPPALRIMEKVKRTIKPVLSDIISADKEESVVQAAAKKILDVWNEA